MVQHDELQRSKEPQKGVVVVQVTLQKDGSLDIEGLRKNTRWTVDKMKGKIFPSWCRSNGEFFNQSEEMEGGVKAVCEEVNGAIPVFVIPRNVEQPKPLKDHSMHSPYADAVCRFRNINNPRRIALHYKKIWKAWI